MFARTLVVLWLPLFLVSNEVNGHDPIHYETRTGRGAYNFGYDTGLSGSHQFHQESRDESGRVRGRYGYTDPTGKLRLVHYSSGSDGYTAWGDVPGPAPNPGFAPPVAYLKAPNDGQRVQYPQSPGKLVGSIKSTQVVGKTVQTPVQVVRQEVKGQIIEPILPVKGLPPPPVKGKVYVPPPPPVKQVVYVQPPPPPPPVKGQVIISPPPVKGKLYVPPPPPPPIKGQIILTPPPVKGQVILPPPPPPPPVKGKIYVPPPPPPPTKTKVFLPPPLPVKGQIVEVPPPVKGQVVELPPPPPVKGQLVELPPPPVKGQVVELPPPPPVKGKVYLPPPPPVKGKVYLPPPPPPLPVKGQRIEQYPVKGQIVEPYSVKATVVRLPSPFPVVQSQQIVEQAPVKGSSVKGEVVVQSPQLVAVPPSRYPPSPVRSAYKRRVEISPSEYRGNYPPAGPYTRCWCE